MFFQSFIPEICGYDFLLELKKRKGVEDTPQKEILSSNVSHRRKMERIMSPYQLPLPWYSFSSYSIGTVFYKLGIK